MKDKNYLECPICLQEHDVSGAIAKNYSVLFFLCISQLAMMFVTPCGHFFCEECIEIGNVSESVNYITMIIILFRIQSIGSCPVCMSTMQRDAALSLRGDYSAKPLKSQFSYGLYFLFVPQDSNQSQHIHQHRHHHRSLQYHRRRRLLAAI